MKKSLWQYRSIMCCMFFLAVTLAFAAETNTRTYSLPDHGAIHLQVPVLWVDQIRQPPGRLPPTITFTQKTSDSFEVLMTTLWAANKEAILPDGNKLRQMVQQAAQEASSQAVEKSIDVVEMKGASGVGFYFSATDRSPEPNGYKCLTQGIIRVGELMITFTILTNDGQQNIVSKALMMLKTAEYKQRT